MRTLALLALALVPSVAPVQPVVDRQRSEVRLPAIVQPHGMSRLFSLQGHHAVVWSGGRSKDAALFVTPVSDHDVRVALDSLGARRGENLTPDVWNARNDPRRREPARRVEGTPIEVFVEWNGKRHALRDLISEKDRRTPLLDFRYGGNEAWQKEFQSGCVVCLYSCPGGAIGNHERTIREYVRDGVVYASLPDRLPPEGTEVVVVLKLATAKENR